MLDDVERHDRDGIVRQQGTPEEVYGAPLDTFVADVVGPANFLPVVGNALADGTVLRATGSGDGAILTELAPGNYTAQVSGVGGATGVALIEVYEVP